VTIENTAGAPAADPSDAFPRRRAATRGFRLGAPRNAAVGPDGRTVLFLRSDGPTDPVNHLWSAWWPEQQVPADVPADGPEIVGVREEKLVDAARLIDGTEDLPPQERARRERLREASGGITGYSVDRDFRRVCFVLSGQLFCHDIVAGTTRRLGTQDGLANPTIDPTGARATATRGGSLLLFDIGSGRSRTLLEPDSDTESWGSAEFVAAEEMGRFRGSWWSPDGRSLLVALVEESPVQTWYIGDPANPASEPAPQRYPAAGTPNADVRLFHVLLDGTATEVAWDRAAEEYLARVDWSEHGDALLAVQNRSQTRLRVLRVDGGSGATVPEVLEEDDRWVELVAGLPRRTAGGILHAVVDKTADTRALELLAQDGPIRTRAGLQVTAVAGDDDLGVTLLGHDGDPAVQDLWRMGWDGKVVRLTDGTGWASGIHRAGTTVVAAGDPASTLSRTYVEDSSGRRHDLASNAEAPSVRPAPQFLVEDGWSRVAILLPSDPRPGPLPIIMSPYGGPHAGRSIKAASAFLVEQWLAERGYCVIVADGPGSPSTPSNEQSIFRDLASGPLAGQMSALDLVARHHGDLVDLSRVGIRGWSFGGYLSALAILERPDVFSAAVAGAPVTEWGLYDTHYTERYLGTPQEDPDAYAASDLPGRASQLERPLLLVHGLADDNVVVAHTLRMSTALLAAGKQHTVLPLSGVTHMTPQEVIAENLLRIEAEFFDEHLRPGQ
jgi:dipeptidyl-peptidase-4